MSRNILILAGVVIAAAAVILYYNNDAKSTYNISETPATAIIAADHSKWLEYTPPQAEFKVMLPKIPRYAVDTILDKKSMQERQYEIFLAQEDNGSVFSITKITFAPDVKLQGDNVIENLLTEMFTENPNNTIKSMTPVSYKGQNAEQFTVENEAGNIHGQAFLQGNTLYVLSTSSKATEGSDHDFDFFLNSFDIQSNKIDSSKK